MNQFTKTISDEIDKLRAQRAEIDKKIDALAVARAVMGHVTAPKAVKAKRKVDRQWLAKMDKFLATRKWRVKTADVAKYFGISKTAAQWRIKQAVSAGKLVRVSRGVFRKPATGAAKSNTKRGK